MATNEKIILVCARDDCEAEFPKNGKQKYCSTRCNVVVQNRRYRERQGDTWKEYARRWRQDHRDRQPEYTRRWYEGNGRDVRARYKVDNREKTRAHSRVLRAVAAGTLVREPCEICGDSTVDAHHEDYTKPLEVRWLCRKHHRETHGNV